MVLASRQRHITLPFAARKGRHGAPLVGAWHAQYACEYPVTSRMSQHCATILNAGIGAVCSGRQPMRYREHERPEHTSLLK